MPQSKTSTEPPEAVSSPRNSKPVGELAGRLLNTHPDLPDLRDRFYQPALIDLELGLGPPPASASPVLDQGREGACTGFALAGAINLLLDRRRQQEGEPDRVSPRMLYEMAKLHDEWPGETYDGSSVRGAVKGFYHNGVCRLDLAPYRASQRRWTLSVEQAKDARRTGLGAYYRLRPEIVDYHSALNEAEVIVASARVHSGWHSPPAGIIEPSERHEGGHAFMIVGYDDEGFLIQNSWGERWGGFGDRGGIAHWSYQDWSRNIFDAWVLRLSVPTPKAFGITHSRPPYAIESTGKEIETPEPRRDEIVGHLIHMDDGNLVEKGRYGTSLDTIKETGRHLIADGDRAQPKYDHLMFYAHGGLNDAAASAKRVRAMKEIFKRNRIYPIHFMWESGFMEEMTDVLARVFQKSEQRVGGFTDFTDWVIENTARVPGRALWREMKRDASRAFVRAGGGFDGVKALLAANAERKKPLLVHLVGHSAGAILHGELISSIKNMGKDASQVSSCSLMAPACTVDYFRKVYEPRIGGKGAGNIGKLVQYNLIDRRERDDSVGPYRKSLLYFVSNAFEDRAGMPLIGMEKHTQSYTPKAKHTLHYAGRVAITDSKTHGGFDNDVATMNDIVTTIIGKAPTPANRFREDDVSGY